MAPPTVKHDILLDIARFSPLVTYLTVSWPQLRRPQVTIFGGFIPFAFFASFSEGHLIRLKAQFDDNFI